MIIKQDIYQSSHLSFYKSVHLSIHLFNKHLFILPSLKQSFFMQDFIIDMKHVHLSLNSIRYRKSIYLSI